MSKKLLLETPAWLDVRAPLEFENGHLPKAFNLGIMNNEERDLVGKKYKQQGSKAAVELGHELVAGEIKNERVKNWIYFLNENPGAILYCYRGGLRSKISQAWLAEKNIFVQRLEGGYKAARNFFIQSLNQFSLHQQFLLISGATGSAKTHFLKKVNNYFPSVDLEGLANHRGSAFGYLGEQPSQSDFENTLSHMVLHLEEYLKVSQLPLLLEDESRLIGSCVLPDGFFHQLRSSPVIWLEVPFDERVENIFKDYILNSAIATQNPEQIIKVYDRLDSALMKISRRLGGLKTSEIKKLLKFSRESALSNFVLDSNRQWISELLQSYYDPMYEHSLATRQPKVAYRGSFAGAEDFLKNLGQGRNKIITPKVVNTKAL